MDMMLLSEIETQTWFSIACSKTLNAEVFIIIQ